MPNRHNVGAEGYRYAYQGQEKDPETGKEAFELRLWDSRIGRWLTVDPAGEFVSPYIGMGNRPTVAIDSDGGDIILLTDSKAVPVGKSGHAAVLIGNDIDGVYVSKNGTGEGKIVGDDRYPDLGNMKIGESFYMWNDFRGTGLNAREVIERVNISNKHHHKHNYDKYIRVITSETEDAAAFTEATRVASLPRYGVWKSSCIDVFQGALLAAFRERAGNVPWYNGDTNRTLGGEILRPNEWRDYLINDGFREMNMWLFQKQIYNFFIWEDSYEIISPRYF